MRIALLGMGTVGGGVYELAAKKGIEVVRVLERVRRTENATTDIADIADDPRIEAVAEMLGGVEPAREYALRCIRAGKHFVTANKLLISRCGIELAREAQNAGVRLVFSAACGGGIPFLPSLVRARESDRIVRAGGILNGTTNYILDRMQREGVDFASALADAQALGYAERDPSGDIDGWDTARKVTLIAAVAFGALPSEDEMPVMGIGNIRTEDVQAFKRRNLVCRLIGETAKTEAGVTACVRPVLFRVSDAESAVLRNDNLCWYQGEQSGLFRLMGQGAGRYPTAANVLTDVLSLNAGLPPMLEEGLKPAALTRAAAEPYYVRVPGYAAETLRTLLTGVSEAGEWRMGETVPMEPAEIQKIISALPGAFCAATVREGGKS